MTTLTDLIADLPPNPTVQERIAAGVKLLRAGEGCRAVANALGSSGDYWAGVRDCHNIPRRQRGDGRVLTADELARQSALIARYAAGESLDALEREGLGHSAMRSWSQCPKNAPPRSRERADRMKAAHKARKVALAARATGPAHE